MMNDQQFCAEVIRRVRETRRNRARMRAGGAVCGGVALAVLFGVFVPRVQGGSGASTAAGQAALLAGGEIGGYVLVALTAFALGAAVMFLCIKWLRK